MDYDRIIFKLKGDKTVRILTPVNASLDECEKRLKREHDKDLVFMTRAKAEDIPADRDFRNALVEDKDKGCKLDLDKCKSIHIDKLRILRNKKLEALDKEMLRAIEDDNAKKIAKIKEDKQILRDMPEIINLDKCTSPEDVKKVSLDDI